MTLDQLCIFVMVAERLNMTRVAETLNMTQSAVSTAIRTLEDSCGVMLFHRVGRHIELTEAGRILLDEAKTIINHVDIAKTKLSDLRGLEGGSITIYASQTIANYWLPPIVCAYRRHYSNIAVRLVVDNTAEVTKAILNGNADLGLIEGNPLVSNQVAQKTLCSDTLIIVVASDHPWTKISKIGPDQLLESDWILREPGSGTRAEFDKALKRIGLGVNRLRKLMELSSNEAVRSAVEAGFGATAISLLVVERAISAGKLHKVDFPPITRPLHLIWHQERYMSKATEAMFNFLCAEASANLCAKAFAERIWSRSQRNYGPEVREIKKLSLRERSEV